MWFQHLFDIKLESLSRAHTGHSGPGPGQNPFLTKVNMKKIVFFIYYIFLYIFGRRKEDLFLF